MPNQQPIDPKLIAKLIAAMKHSLSTPSPTGWGTGYDAATECWLEELEALLPAPKPKTMADMTPEERDGCLWMQCEPGGIEGRVIIASIGTSGATLIAENGGKYTFPHRDIAPLVDEPRMVWPAPETNMSIISPKIDTSAEHDDSVNTSPDQPPGATMSAPDYADELAHAQRLASEALESIDAMTISETLPDKLFSTEAVDRIQRLIPYLIVGVSADVERNYLTKGQPR